MSAMKRRLENLIEGLATKSGYSTAFLYQKYYECVDAAAEDGEAFDIGYFVGVTMERDW